jgi:2-methylaconitate cis-trans-isomerase PrpF
LDFGEQRSIRCVFMRGGTSRGAFFDVADLPSVEAVRDRVILSIYGSPDRRQVDGLGGADALTSKVILIARPTRAGVDIEYTFGQVGIDVPKIYWVGNCGNMLAGVAIYAVDEGFVSVTEPTTRVRIFNTNTAKVIEATVPVRSGKAASVGDTAIAGVRRPGAPIRLDFLDLAGAVTGRLLPTGNARDVLQTSRGPVECSIVDAATPFVFVRAESLGMRGSELPSQIDADADLLDRAEALRSAAAVACGLVAPGSNATAASPSIPRLAVVSAAEDYATSNGDTVRAAEVTFRARQFAMQRAHKTYAVTGAMCTAVAARIPGTVVEGLALGAPDPIRIGHPAGVIEVLADIATVDGQIEVRRCGVVRTARRIMDGFAYAPATLFTDDVLAAPLEPEIARIPIEIDA